MKSVSEQLKNVNVQYFKGGKMKSEDEDAKRRDTNVKESGIRRSSLDHNRHRHEEEGDLHQLLDHYRGHQRQEHGDSGLCHVLHILLDPLRLDDGETGLTHALAHLFEDEGVAVQAMILTLLHLVREGKPGHGEVAAWNRTVVHLVLIHEDVREVDRVATIPAHARLLLVQ